jgi:hypothetical protein
MRAVAQKRSTHAVETQLIHRQDLAANPYNERSAVGVLVVQVSVQTPQTPIALQSRIGALTIVYSKAD